MGHSSGRDPRPPKYPLPGVWGPDSGDVLGHSRPTPASSSRSSSPAVPRVLAARAGRMVRMAARHDVARVERAIGGPPAPESDGRHRSPGRRSADGPRGPATGTLATRAWHRCGTGPCFGPGRRHGAARSPGPGASGTATRCRQRPAPDRSAARTGETGSYGQDASRVVDRLAGGGGGDQMGERR
jgi:hypothetical protein